MSKTCKTAKKPGEHVPELWTGYISRILPNIFNLIRGIHSLYDNKIWTGISVECTLGIIGISDKEKNAATGIKVSFIFLMLLKKDKVKVEMK